MKSREIPPCKTKVPDPYKFHAILYEIWFAEHGVPGVKVTFEDPKEEKKTDTPD